jgi:hypothetical protein
LILDLNTPGYKELAALELLRRVQGKPNKVIATNLGLSDGASNSRGPLRRNRALQLVGLYGWGCTVWRKSWPAAPENRVRAACAYSMPHF